jgi:ribosomal peptide maturation radical SAM protein 1
MDFASTVPSARPRVILVSPPWRMPDEGSLALATLRPILLEAGVAADTLHGSLLYPPTALDPLFLSAFAQHLFVPLLYPEANPDGVIDALVARFVDELGLQGLVVPGATSLAELERDEAAMRRDLAVELGHARRCVDACVEVIVAGGYDVVGLSATFETQLTAALAIARRLKARNPSLRIALGGAACFGEPAQALAESFAELDCVCSAEADDLVVPLFRALLDGTPLNTIPGLAFRVGTEVRTTAPPPLLRDLDRLPPPDYDDFIAALAASPWSEHAPKLYFETSRGCWWGQKTLCTFCGLNAEGLTFRRKSPARAIAEITRLVERYPSARRLQATDNILDLDYLDTVMPALAELERAPERPLRLFWEVKSNLRRRDLDRLVAAGVDLVQPGIESFSDGVLDLMRKGNTALGQVQFLKWAVEAGLGVTYNLLVRNPGEQARWYETMLDLIDTLEHLPPPDCVTTTWLERFSPYHAAPGSHGITAIRARPHYGSLFQGAPVPLERLAYVFDYDHPDHHDAALLDAQHRFVRRVGLWQQGWRPAMATWREDGGAALVDDARGGQARRHVLTHQEAAVFRLLDRARQPAALARERPDLAESLDAALHHLARLRLTCSDERGRYLAVIPQEYAAESQRPRHAD